MIRIETFDYWNETCAALGSAGALLVTGRIGNPMTIGWATLGVVWGRPIMSVMVRPSRYSFELLEAEPYFSVNVLDIGVCRDKLSYCGTTSGRDENKALTAGITIREGHSIPIPIIPQARLVYECAVVHRTSVIDADLHPDIRRKYYGHGDLHRIYHGEVLGTWKNDHFSPSA